jgi:hypothetical protein
VRIPSIGWICLALLAVGIGYGCVWWLFLA